MIHSVINRLMLASILLPFACNGSFDDTWFKMQKMYSDLKYNLKDMELPDFVQPGWKKAQEQMEKDIIRGAPKHNFLFLTPISGTIVKSSCISPYHKLLYLEYCLSEQTKNLLSKFEDTSIGGNKIEHFGYSYDGLEQLYFFSKILEANKKPIQTIFELGGGYGCLARIAKTILPDSTYIIFDLPESIAIQYLFLNLTMPNELIVVHSKAKQALKSGCINLIPIHHFDALDIKAEVFVSNFALSETTLTMLNAVIDRNFFNADTCYLTGQMNYLTHHLIVMNAIRNNFATYNIDLYNGYHDYYVIKNFVDYEIIASR